MKRHWPGKVPEWAGDYYEDGDIRMARVDALEKVFWSRKETDFMQKDDPRLRRLAESRMDNREEVREDHRRIRQVEIVSNIEEESRRQEELDLECEDENAMEEQRRRIREKLLQREQEEAALMPEEEDEVEEEEESEYETDSEEELMGILMVKPIFVPKSERDTIAERERLKAEERALDEAVKKMMEERRVETKQIVVEKIREDQEIQRCMELEANIVGIHVHLTSAHISIFQTCLSASSAGYEILFRSSSFSKSLLENKFNQIQICKDLKKEDLDSNSDSMEIVLLKLEGLTGFRCRYSETLSDLVLFRS
ncbi:microfibrillar-associated 1-like [Olea europaea subsp. europaea]|uniref:Microfibrillar-associated 1-like n=1 Tax=Olea europaea subsp. europaea TaxID=158383 RepID=A0A8S0V1T3_OLEEU|nr:microfibrillar-associated 1-like [Olea europaea subsp. europaea]